MVTSPSAGRVARAPSPAVAARQCSLPPRTNTPASPGLGSTSARPLPLGRRRPIVGWRHPAQSSPSHSHTTNSRPTPPHTAPFAAASACTRRPGCGSVCSHSSVARLQTRTCWRAPRRLGSLRPGLAREHRPGCKPERRCRRCRKPQRAAKRSRAREGGARGAGAGARAAGVGRTIGAGKASAVGWLRGSRVSWGNWARKR